jgi:hypothetical protein
MRLGTPDDIAKAFLERWLPSFRLALVEREAFLNRPHLRLDDVELERTMHAALITVGERTLPDWVHQTDARRLLVTLALAPPARGLTPPPLVIEQNRGVCPNFWAIVHVLHELGSPAKSGAETAIPPAYSRPAGSTQPRADSVEATKKTKRVKVDFALELIHAVDEVEELTHRDRLMLAMHALERVGEQWVLPRGKGRAMGRARRSVR